MEFRNVKYQYLTNDFQFLEQKLGVKTGYGTYGIEATKTNILKWRLLMSSLMKAAIHLGLNYGGEPRNLQKHELRADSELVQHHGDDIGTIMKMF